LGYGAMLYSSTGKYCFNALSLWWATGLAIADV
jgi:hypothetical protein